MEYTFTGLPIAALLIMISLPDCAGLSRFERETYDCSATDAPFNRVVLTAIEAGQSANVEGGAPPQADIVQTGAREIETTWGDGAIKLDRTNGAVRVIRGGMVRSYPCKRSLFQM